MILLLHVDLRLVVEVTLCTWVWLELANKGLALNWRMKSFERAHTVIVRLERTTGSARWL